MRKKTANTEFNYINILVIDDEKEILDTINKLITDNGYNCVTTTSSKEALDIIKKDSPHIDILVADYLMVGTTAAQLIESIRTFNKDIYIMLLTAFPKNIPAMYAMKNLSIDSYSEKSANFSDFLLKLEIAIKTIQKHFSPKHEDNLKLSEKLKNLRLEKNMTQDEVAKYLGVGRTTVLNYEHGRIKPSIKNISKLAKLFEVKVDYLID